jgi:hypothetical protein
MWFAHFYLSKEYFWYFIVFVMSNGSLGYMFPRLWLCLFVCFTWSSATCHVCRYWRWGHTLCSLMVRQWNCGPWIFCLLLLWTFIGTICVENHTSDPFGSRKKKRDERKLRKPMYEFGLTLVQVYVLVSVIFFSPSCFPSNQTDPSSFNNLECLKEVTSFIIRIM